MAQPLVFTARTRTAWSPPLQHQDPATNTTEVDCVHWPLYQALRPGSRTVAEATVMLLVVASRADCPKAVLRAGRFRDPRYEPQAVRPSPETHGVPEGLCRCGPARRLLPSARSVSGGVRCCRSNERCGSPKRNVNPQAESLHVPSGEGWSSQARSRVSSQAVIRANTKFTQPQVWPTPAGRTGQDSLTNRRDNRQHVYAGARVAAKVCCDPVVVGPRTSQSVRLAVRRGKPACLIPSGRSRRGA